ncbi:ATP-binding protein [Rhodobacteraceae bacterium CCMM004]|nr:ATP-binding protein [Rhodobacteraceae bacterium CCMM004]
MRPCPRPMPTEATPRAPAAPTGPPRVRVIFQSDPMAVRAGLLSLRQGIGRLGIDGDLEGALELVLAEVLNNVVEHAYGAAARGLVDVRVGAVRGQIDCTVVDAGRPMPGGAMPPGTPPAPFPEPEGGFGWMIIRQLAQDLSYRREDGRNCLSFRLAGGLDASAA